MEDRSQLTLDTLIAEIQDLEEAYANELAAGANKMSLNLIHNRIKQISYEIKKIQQQQNQQR